MMIVGGIIIGLVIILFVLVLVVCCRKSNSELITIRLEKEVALEKAALEAYKKRMSYSPARYPSEDGTPAAKYKTDIRSPKK